MSGSDFIELPSPYGSGFGPFGFGSGSHARRHRSISGSLGSLRGKGGATAAGSYNPILTTPQEEYDSGRGLFQQQLGGNERYPPAPATALRPGRIGKFGVDLLVEIALCAFAVLAVVPFLWLAVTMAKYHGDRVTESDTNFIKQATSTVGCRAGPGLHWIKQY